MRKVLLVVALLALPLSATAAPIVCTAQDSTVSCFSQGTQSKVDFSKIFSSNHSFLHTFVQSHVSQKVKHWKRPHRPHKPSVSVPEPSSFALLGIGILGMLLFRRRLVRI